MLRTDVHAGWTVRAVDGPVPPEIGTSPITATVPGTVHTDLLAAGLIPDPYTGVHEAELAWMHRTAWRYDTTLSAAPAAAGERVDLVFDGLDTVATVRLGETELGRTANMHRGYRFDVRTAVGTDLPLSVRFDSALTHAEAVQERVGSRPRAYDHPFNTVRKMACSFGWDWGPDLQTAGIFKPVRLERWRVARLAGVRPLATLDADGATGRLAVHVEVERSGLDDPADLPVRVTVTDLPGRPDGLTGTLTVAAGADGGVLELVVPQAPVWWPAGHGAQPLAGVTVELLDPAGGAVLDTYARRIGFRSVALDESPDEAGTRFALRVNGRDIFVLGLNWIPEDHLLTRLTRQHYADAVDRAVAANANLLRIWGGGVYESDDFYDVCDERGIMVWQDFLLACAAYTEEDPISSEILAEARENVTRLSSHASLVIWNGGNENIWGHEDWHWKERLGDLSWGARYYYEDFPALLAELDPTRPYHPGSPSSPGFDPEVVHPNDDRHGTRHEWEAWNREDYTFHDGFTPRFCSEFGWQAPPTWATLTAALAPADLHKRSPAFLLHQKAVDGNGKLDRGLAHHLPVPEDFTEWHWATQLNQARATTYAVEHLRSHAPHTMGSILWQLNDCWPVTSWAVVDGDGRRKPAWYAVRRSYAPRMVTLQVRDGAVALVAVNDTDGPWHGHVRLRRLGFDGTELAAARVELRVPARSVTATALARDLLAVADATREVLVADVDDLRAVRLFAEDVDLAYDPAAVSARAARADGGYTVTVSASAFARDVAVLADRVAPDAVVDDMLVTLLPGESHTFTVRTAATVDPAAFTAPEVLRTANTLVVPAGGPVMPAAEDGSPGLIGLVLTGNASRVGVEPFFMELVAGMEEALTPARVSVLLLVVPDLPAELATYHRWAADGTVAAVVVANLVHDDVRPARLAALGLPAVLAGRYSGPAAFTSVQTDDAGAMSAAMHLLASLGHRVVGRLSGPAELVHTAERSAAMREAGERLDVDVRIVEADYSAEAGVRGARELLAATPPPTAIVFDNDVMAVAAQEDLVRSGVRVPDQLSVLACDDSALCELAVPPLSAMSIDVHEHGVTLGRALLDVLNGAPRRDHAGPPIRILHRNTTAPAPTPAPTARRS